MKKPAGKSRKGAVHHSADKVAKAMALLIAGEAVDEVARKLKIPKQTVSDWKKQLPEVGQGRTRIQTVENLLTEYMEQVIQAKLAQLRMFSDEKWLRSQKAPELSDLHTKLLDDFIRVYDAAKRGEERRRSAGQLGPAPEDRE